MKKYTFTVVLSVSLALQATQLCAKPSWLNKTGYVEDGFMYFVCHGVDEAKEQAIRLAYLDGRSQIQATKKVDIKHSSSYIVEHQTTDESTDNLEQYKQAIYTKSKGSVSQTVPHGENYCIKQDIPQELFHCSTRIRVPELLILPSQTLNRVLESSKLENDPNKIAEIASSFEHVGMSQWRLYALKAGLQHFGTNDILSSEMANYYFDLGLFSLAEDWINQVKNEDIKLFLVQKLKNPKLTWFSRYSTNAKEIKLGGIGIQGTSVTAKQDALSYFLYESEVLNSEIEQVAKSPIYKQLISDIKGITIKSQEQQIDDKKYVGYQISKDKLHRLLDEKDGQLHSKISTLHKTNTAKKLDWYNIGRHLEALELLKTHRVLHKLLNALNVTSAYNESWHSYYENKLGRLIHGQSIFISNKSIKNFALHNDIINNFKELGFEISKEPEEATFLVEILEKESMINDVFTSTTLDTHIRGNNSELGSVMLSVSANILTKKLQNGQGYHKIQNQLSKKIGQAIKNKGWDYFSSAASL